MIVCSLFVVELTMVIELASHNDMHELPWSFTVDPYGDQALLCHRDPHSSDFQLRQHVSGLHGMAGCYVCPSLCEAGLE